MTSKPATPIPKEASTDVDNSRVDQSEDESDTNQDLAKRYSSVDAPQDKSHDQDTNYTVEANTDYSLFNNPPNLGALRQRLFEVKEEVELSDKDFEIYFPFVDNVWRKNRLPEAQRDGEGTSETYCCRLKPTGQAKTPTPKPSVEGKQQRRKRKREEKTCPMTMKVTYLEGPVRKVRISKIDGQDLSHTHDLNYMDSNKRNTAIMDVARREAHRGFLPGSIFWKMQEEQEKMNEAGGRFMKVSDVRNVQYPWRQMNPTVILKAHSGYSQQRTGPRQRPATGSAPSTPKNGDSKPQRPPPEVFVPPPEVFAPLSQPPPRAQPAPPPLPHGSISYPDHLKAFLTPYLPHHSQIANQQRPHVTLTWATSLDSRIALMPGVQTAISGPETKGMTHYLRSHHDAILIGVKTAISDDPGLNCRLAGAGGFGGPHRVMQPRPIIIDPHARLHIHSNMRLLKAVSEGKAIGPWIVVGPNTNLHPVAVTTLKAHGGEFLQINEIHPDHGLDWNALFSIFYREGIKSIMIEGGGKVLSELLHPRYTNSIDSVIITIAPTFFGRSGVEVSPETAFDGQQPLQTRLLDIKWQGMGASDMVLCAHLEKPRFQPRLPGINEIARQHGPPPPTQPPHPAQSSSHGQPPQPHLAQPVSTGHTPQSHHAQASNSGQLPQPLQPAQLHHLQAGNPGPPPQPHHAARPQLNGTNSNAPDQRSPRFRQYGPPASSRPS